ncbi:MAG: hypothetical protein QOD26_539 [Betaproteobacteria bacterium]|jgi:uncharacterized protein HemX|nr:hypothetical protein [Betaproteobacteria bacterium]
MNTRTILLAVVAVAAVGAAAWHFVLQDMLDPPAKPMAVAPKADAPKPQPPVAAAPGADAAKPAPAGAPSADDVKAAQSRVGELEKQVADLQRQVAMKNQQIAELEKKTAGKK